MLCENVVCKTKTLKLFWNSVALHMTADQMTFLIAFVYICIYLFALALIQSSIAIHTETSHLICNGNQTNSFCVKCNNGLKWVKATLDQALS